MAAGDADDAASIGERGFRWRGRRNRTAVCAQLKSGPRRTLCGANFELVNRCRKYKALQDERVEEEAGKSASQAVPCLVHLMLPPLRD
jgi:hypothetical protein